MWRGKWLWVTGGILYEVAFRMDIWGGHKALPYGRGGVYPRPILNAIFHDACLTLEA